MKNDKNTHSEKLELLENQNYMRLKNIEPADSVDDESFLSYVNGLA